MPQKQGPLVPYRALDLTDEKGFLCGKVLADLGAEVIKVEPPGGDPARSIGSLRAETPGQPGSLCWAAFNTGKKSITLDLESPADRQVLRQLARTADFLVESFSPGYLDSLGAGYRDLRQENPRLIMASITPFGQKGPFAHWKGPDIVPWAMSGYMWMTGEPGRAPLRISGTPQAYLHAGAITAAGLLLALRHRHLTGRGQHIDTSAQQCPTWMLTHTYAYWDLLGVKLGRAGVFRQFGESFLRTVWPCRDGHVVFMFAGGQIGAKGQRSLVSVMGQEGMADDWLREFNWEEWGATAEGQDAINRVSEAFARYFRTKTRAELLEIGVKHAIMLAPVNSVADLLASPQLEHRRYWVEHPCPHTSTVLRYPGAPCRLTESPWQVRGHTAGVGEHNQEVLGATAYQIPLSSGQTPQPHADAQEGGLPLDGVKVLDFSATVLGPTVTRYMADHGATVVKVESINHPETTRTATPFAGRQEGINRSGYFATHNAGKLGLSLDLGKPAGREVARRLVRWADVVIETFTPGVMARWGLGYQDLREIRPDVIMASSSLQGQTGPLSSHRGYGMVSAALTGWFEMTGWPDREPVGPYSAYSDFVGWNYLLVSILAALDYRERTGKGQYIDHSHVEGGAHFMALAILDYCANRRIASRMGNRDTRFVPHGAFRCHGEDAWCVIAVTTEDEWQAFSQALGKPAWTEDARFATPAARKENEDELEKLVEAWTVEHSKTGVAHLLQEAGVPAGPVEDAEDLLRDPQLAHRRAFVTLDHPEIGSYRITSAAFRFSGLDNLPQSPSPLLGEHNQHILKDFLGMSDSEIANLVAEGALE